MPNCDECCRGLSTMARKNPGSSGVGCKSHVGRNKLRGTRAAGRFPPLAPAALEKPMPELRKLVPVYTTLGKRDLFADGLRSESGHVRSQIARGPAGIEP